MGKSCTAGDHTTQNNENMGVIAHTLICLLVILNPIISLKRVNLNFPSIKKFLINFLIFIFQYEKQKIPWNFFFRVRALLVLEFLNASTYGLKETCTRVICVFIFLAITNHIPTTWCMMHQLQQLDSSQQCSLRDTLFLQTIRICSNTNVTLNKAHTLPPEEFGFPISNTNINKNNDAIYYRSRVTHNNHSKEDNLPICHT